MGTGLCVGPVQGRRFAARGRVAARRAPWLAGVSGRGAGARTRWTVGGLWPQTEQSGLQGGGRPRGGQPDVESVGRTLRSVWRWGCRGGGGPECGARGARGAAVGEGEAAGPAHPCRCRPSPGRLPGAGPGSERGKQTRLRVFLSFFATPEVLFLSLSLSETPGFGPEQVARGRAPGAAARKGGREGGRARKGREGRRAAAAAAGLPSPAGGGCPASVAVGSRAAGKEGLPYWFFLIMIWERGAGFIELNSRRVSV